MCAAPARSTGTITDTGRDNTPMREVKVTEIADENPMKETSK